MSDNKFCSDCPAYWEYDYREWRMYKRKPTRVYHTACEAMPMLVKYSKATSYATMNNDSETTHEKEML